MLFNHLSINFVLRLWRVKCETTIDKDEVALANLEMVYPELFTADFESDIIKIVMANEYYKKYLKPTLSLVK